MANLHRAAPVLDKLRLFGADGRGLAAIDFAITSLMLALGLVNAVDLGFYIFRRMEVENAAEAGAQVAWKTCNDLSGSNQLPATPNNYQNCPALPGAITTAIQSTSLGTNVTLASGYPTEGYYCANASNVLQFVGSASSPAPADCSAAGNAGTSPGDYIQVGVTYPYTPIFSGLSVMGKLGWTSITKTSWMRLG